MTDAIEDRVNCVYNTGQNILKKMTNDQIALARENKEKQNEATMQRIQNMQMEDPRFKEAERLRRDINEMEMKFTAQEEQKKEKIRAARQARIEEHLRSVQHEKQLKALAEEKRLFDLAGRLKNTEVNRIFEAEQREIENKRFADMRQTLDKQTAANAMIQRAQELGSTDCATELRYVTEEPKLLEHANNVMDHRRNKGRPLYPFGRAVENYKRENNINVPEKVPSHMATNITIGVDTNAAVVNKKSKYPEKCAAEGKEADEEIYKNMERINKMIADEAEEKKKPCLKTCPIECNLYKLRSNGLGGLEPTPSGRLRYSVWELKQLKQYNETAECTMHPQPVLT